MKRDIFSYRIFVCTGLCIWLLLSGAESFGYPAGSNGWHLNSSFQAKVNADLVCKVQILSIHQKKIVKGNLFPGQQDWLGMIATSKVLSVIKGECPDVIDIEFQRPKNNNSMLGRLPGELYTDLSENEVCLVFLKASGPNYKPSRIQSKARVRPEVVDYNLGETPNLKLLAEFLAGRDSDSELVKLQAAEEIGYLGNQMISELRSSKADKDMFQRTVSALGRAKEALRKCINSDRSNSWEPRHFYDPDAAREYMNSGIEKKLEDRQKDYQDNEQEYILHWKNWWQQHKNDFKRTELINDGTD